MEGENNFVRRTKKNIFLLRKLINCVNTHYDWCRNISFRFTSTIQVSHVCNNIIFLLNGHNSFVLHLIIDFCRILGF